MLPRLDIDPEYGMLRFRAVRAVFWLFALTLGVLGWAIVAAAILGAIGLTAGVVYAIVASF